jgi:hypothetical protein
MFLPASRVSASGSGIRILQNPSSKSGVREGWGLSALSVDADHPTIYSDVDPYPDPDPNPNCTQDRNLVFFFLSQQCQFTLFLSFFSVIVLIIFNILGSISKFLEKVSLSFIFLDTGPPKRFRSQWIRITLLLKKSAHSVLFEQKNVSTGTGISLMSNICSMVISVRIFTKKVKVQNF